MVEIRHKGKAKGIERVLIGVVEKPTIDKLNTFIVNTDCGKRAEISKSEFISNDYNLGIGSLENINSISPGDIVGLYPSGRLMNFYRKAANHNSLFLTERCNSNCLMCSQPPKDRNDIDELYDWNCRIVDLLPPDATEIGLTGGEPTILGERFFSLLRRIQNKNPNIEIQVLTNGRNFADIQNAKKFSELDISKILLGIPLYSDHYQSHDYVVQAEDAFLQTMLGFHNLAKYNARMEVRVVLHKKTYQRLPELSMFIYKNLPFVEHIAFMGMENTGLALIDFSDIWMEPAEYMNKLGEAVLFLSKRKMNPSIFNTPLCLLPENLREFAKQSISDWKNDFHEECGRCKMAKECSGFFTTSKHPHSNMIKAII